VTKSNIEAKLRAAFFPSHLEVTDESHLHIGHTNYQPGGNSHFSVVIVSPLFCGLSRVERHQKVYECLRDELKNEVHALRLKTLCPEEESRAAG
jgi:BolA protein